MSSQARAGALGCVAGGTRDSPRDPDDCRRCLLLLERVPDARLHRDRVAALSSQGAALVAPWDEVDAACHAARGPPSQAYGSAPQTSAWMQDIYASTTRQKPSCVRHRHSQPTHGSVSWRAPQPCDGPRKMTSSPLRRPAARRQRPVTRCPPRRCAAAKALHGRGAGACTPVAWEKSIWRGGSRA